jgi:hypothetical protein
MALPPPILPEMDCGNCCGSFDGETNKYHRTLGGCALKHQSLIAEPIEGVRLCYHAQRSDLWFVVLPFHTLRAMY